MTCYITTAAQAPCCSAWESRGKCPTYLGPLSPIRGTWMEFQAPDFDLVWF